MASIGQTYFSTKFWLSEQLCEGVAPIAPDLFAASCTRFISGFFVSIELLLLASVFGFIIAIGLAIARTSEMPVISMPAFVYCYVFRGTPLLVQLWIFYFGFGALGPDGLGPLWPLFRDAYWVGVITLTVNTSAYAAEIFRGGMVNVPKGQVEAAVATGMDWWTRLRRIILPQALTISWPAYSNEVILLLKGSALVSTITVLDLMGQTRTIFSRSYNLEIFLYAIVLYLVLSGTLTILLRMVEARMRVSALGTS